MKKLINPSFNEELTYWNQGIDMVIGMDEVGRGAFAGPIVGAGVIYKPNFKHKYLKHVNDSKLLRPKQREELSLFIKENSIWVIDFVDVYYINKYGIGKANAKVFEKVIKKVRLQTKESHIGGLVDGHNLGIPNCKGIIHGDQISLSIASASIIAKVYRDNSMKKFADKYPGYGFETNVGYGTKKHRDAINKFGLCDLHRTSFNLSKFLS